MAQEITNYPWNITTVTNNTNATLPSMLTHTITTNLFWWFPLTTLVFAVALWILFANDPGKEKIIFIAFLTMLYAWILRMFTLSGTTTPTIWTGVFISVFMWYLLTRDR